MILKNLQKFSKNVALITPDSKIIKYKDLIQSIENFKFHIKENKKLTFLFCSNDAEIIIAYLSFLDLRNPLMLIDSSLEDKKINELINSYNPEYIFLNKNNLNQKMKKMYSINNTNGIFINLKIKKNFLIKKKINKHLSILLGTSGSLGSSKYVKLTNKNIEDNTKKIIKYLNLKTNDRTITTLPFNYSYGFSIVNSHLLAGASIVLSNFSLLEQKFWKLYEDNNITNFNGVPFTYEILMKLKFNKFFNKNLKFITQAGGRMNSINLAECLKLCIKNKVNLFTMYGQTEASPRMSYVNLSKYKNKVGSIGKVLDGCKFSLNDAYEKKILSPNIEGELIFEGNNIFKGYAESYKNLEILTNKSKLKTGDIAKFDKDGFFFITGRKKRFIKIYGIRFGLDEMEKTLENKFKLRFYCVGVDNKLTILTENTNKNNYTISKVSEFLKIKQKNIEIKINKNIPTKNNGKIDYLKLQKQYN